MRRIFLTIIWLITDALIFVGAYSVAYFLKVGWIFSSDLPFETFFTATLMTVGGWLIVMITMRNLALSRIQMSPRNFAYIAYACIIGMAGFALSFYFLKQTLFSRLLLLLAGTLSLIFVCMWHILFDQIQRRILRMNPPTYPLLVIGTNREAERLIEKLQRKRSPIVPVAILDGKGTSKTNIDGIPVLGKLDKLEQTIDEKKITHLVQCDQIEHSLNLLSVCRSKGITYMLLPYTLGIIEDRVPAEALEGKQVVAVPRGTSRLGWFFR
ncbi:MAG TPA: hypothetical protein VJB82_00930 [Candidatus Peribacterales bacterium]|nr:hypothetical protein [Candidatus Peribacterales bacterium]